MADKEPMSPLRNRAISLSGLFIALGWLLPTIFHAVGLGSIFLPMFWPVAMAAFFLPWSFALFVAAATPLLSSLLTGMPPISPPILHLMVAELVSLAGTVIWLRRVSRLGLFWLLFIGLLVSRVVCFFAAMTLAGLFGLPPSWSGLAMVLKGMPGIIAMLFILPPWLHRLTHESVFKQRERHG